MAKKGMFDGLISLSSGKTSLSISDDNKAYKSIKEVPIVPVRPAIVENPDIRLVERIEDHEKRLAKLEAAQEKASQPAQGFDKIKQIQKLLRSAPLEVKETEFFKTLEYIVQS